MYSAHFCEGDSFFQSVESAWNLAINKHTHLVINKHAHLAVNKHTHLARNKHTRKRPKFRFGLGFGWFWQVRFGKNFAELFVIQFHAHLQYTCIKRTDYAILCNKSFSQSQQNSTIYISTSTPIWQVTSTPIDIRSAFSRTISNYVVNCCHQYN